MIDSAIFGGGNSSTQKRFGPRLENLDVMTSTEGNGIPWINGRAKVGGTVIWATRIKETADTDRDKYKTGKHSSQTVESTTYSYSVSFALALADTRGSAVRHFGRIWANNRLLDPSTVEVRFYRGTEAQDPDPLIVAIEGEAPAYRGVAYLVFEDLPLADYGNRIPQITVEVFAGSGEVEGLIRGVDLIPGSTEWGYMPEVVKRIEHDSHGEVVREAAENSHRFPSTSDWAISIDTLQGTLPNVGTVALVVTWFGDDLRAGLCTVRPKVENKLKATDPAWLAGGLDRATADLISQKAGRPVYGSTPADRSVIEAIRDLTARGLRVVLYPFVMMDIPEGELPDPSGVGFQGENPWRGRIRATAGESVATEIAAFLGTAEASDFDLDGDAVDYTGPAEWSYRRFILHLAHLAAAAGGVDAFLIGSETVGLTQSTEPGSGDYPFVDGLVALAADVSAVLPDALISYAADWSEYHSHRPADGSGDVFFNLDPLWTSPHVDFVGIDNYLPLSDWRPGADHADYDPEAGHVSIYDLDYLKANVEGGEYFDWFYASTGDRLAQVRTPIADTAHGEHWVFRQKAIRDWFGHTHRHRPGGVRDASGSGWTANAKPLWFTECGCPAVDHGTNQPNLFSAVNTSESGLPWFSAGLRDDFIARQYLRALLEWWRDNGADLLDPADVLVWAWDARPWPEFPTLAGIWADAAAWRRGHWLNGRAGAMPAADAIRRRLLTFHGWQASDLDLSGCYGQADGYAMAGPTAFRDWSQPLEIVLRIDAAFDRGVLTFRSRSAAIPAAALDLDDLIDAGEASRFTLTRSGIEDAARAVILRYVDGSKDYESGAARVAIEAGLEDGIAEADTPLVLDKDRATVLAETILRTSAAARERIALALPPSAQAVRPGSLFSLDLPEVGPQKFIVEKVARGETMKVEAAIYAPGAFALSAGIDRAPTRFVEPGSSTVLAAFLDLPVLAGSPAADHVGFIAAHAEPWPGGFDAYRSAEETAGFALNTRGGLRATIGETVTALDPGRLWGWSGETVEVELFAGSLVTRSDEAVLAGKNALAIEHSPGAWEVLQFATAELVADRTWRISRLLRGQRGTEGARGASPLAAGARVVLLDLAVAPVEMTAGEVGRAFFWRYGPAGKNPEGKGFKTRAHTFAGIGRRPFAPVHLTARLGGSGDLAIEWIRRTRIDGDGWPEDDGDVPLGETVERYRVEVRDGATLVRAWTVTGATSTTYTVAAQAADAIAAPFRVRVQQISETFGRGARAEVEFTG
ncbi:glycoside hydrolase TIM-barrel-like domain-containing protein [Amaricoccus sp.]|uniref:baseplate multidomain protein megatron n=1 Tax=Amaricoccus sp. TaxID=1872485 RepID=UPI001B534579|nr:glycoside hydrolase TIM-barrel-like domain-containing protein [Amaricoccus sp.]MBP7001723.1 glycoside hydrolase TIM-barrel-like domain-containing protein [Amaricoccus sp.]